MYIIQQAHFLPSLLVTLGLIVIVVRGAGLGNFSFNSAAVLEKICWIPMFSLALTSANIAPIDNAYVSASLVVTTCVSTRSLLLPTRYLMIALLDD